MANICTFKMKVKGSMEKVRGFASQIRCSSVYNTDVEAASDGEIVFYVMGEVRWSVTASLAKPEEGVSLKELSEQFNVEVEIFGYDMSEPEWIEHFHYDKGKVIKEYNLPKWFEAWEYEDGEIEIDVSKYDYVEEAEIYVLKAEHAEPFEWDEINGDMIVLFDMTI